jgi:Myb-like DNA-binding domain
VEKYGPTKWSVIAKQLPGRIGKQCRERYKSHFILVKPSWGEMMFFTYCEVLVKMRCLFFFLLLELSDGTII